MPFVQTERGRFFYNEYGSIGPVVYLLHGLTAKNEDWEAIPDILAKTTFHVFAFDMRGHGRSDGSKSSPRANQEQEKDYSPENHAKDIESCAKALGHSRVHLVGHSTGGRNALVHAALFPERAWTLTIVDQTLKADPTSFVKYVDRYREFPTPFKDLESLEKFINKKFKKDPRYLRYYKGQFWQNKEGLWDWNFSTTAAWMTQKLGREKDVYDWLEKVKCPILFIKGGQSVYVSPEEADKIEKMMPDGQMVWVPHAEHAVFRDEPEGFLRVLVPFLLKKSQGKLFMPYEEKGQESPAEA